MDLAEVQQLVERGEGTTLEFKKSTGELREAMESLCGMLNAEGLGAVLFGVSNAGEILGQDVADRTLNDIANESRKLEPKADVVTRRVELASGRVVLVVEGRSAGPGPYTFDGRPYLRVDRTTQQMSRDEFDRRVVARLYAQQPWDGWPVRGWSLDELDAEEIVRAVDEAVMAKRLAGVLGEPKEQVLRRLELLTDEGLTRAAVILFGRNDRPAYPIGQLRLARFAGTTKSEFRDNRQYDGNAFHLLDLAERFLRESVPVASRFVPGQMARIDIPKYPPLAVREALINGLIHRDYSPGGGAVSLAVYDDRLEVSSSGPLPPGMTVEKLKGTHDSVPRNPLVATTFHRRGLIERWGRGTNRIIEECERAGCPAPDFEDTGLSVVVRFRPVASPRVEKTPERRPIADRVVEILQEAGPLGAQGLLARLGSSPITVRALQKHLARLRKDGRIVVVGKGKTTRYRTEGPTTVTEAVVGEPFANRSRTGSRTRADVVRRHGQRPPQEKKKGSKAAPRPRPKPRTRRGSGSGSGVRR